ncbi:pseudouridine synthase [Gilvimarinus sp. SDUM040013]|uniref:Pseudouridine synthase n=1 Tax=Gilvimarinus gilvus TaxID=3058038 RepID=A0ABU4RXY3_9GAMM|nr:pseudouridine synthase [Gilvimarinus sp. SDUM040013]MDO3386467.1 pseudouridine synthase [Gilvimarinus sp. SDUM040013]MDX6849733.1 pseudouridine synthase [Gilvimarinus sp. SDUM040013]
MRLDKFIAHSAGLSRKQVKIALHHDQVCVDEQTVRNGGIIVNSVNTITLDGQVLALSGPRYFMLHKPKGVVCANQDASYPTVLDLLKETNSDTLQIAGRLDVDTTGLVLITDDGQWNHRATSPKVGKNKTYQVTTREAITQALIEALEAGVHLKGETKPCRPAQVKILDQRCAQLTINEGKYHQVKRMFAAAGNHVVALHRNSIGDIALDPTLTEGQYRPLNDIEINSI